MADLSQFLNSGGKRYRAASVYNIELNHQESVSLTVATDEFMVFKARDGSTAATRINPTGRSAMDLPVQKSTVLPIALGVGEGATISHIGTAGEPCSGIVVIYEEDA